MKSLFTPPIVRAWYKPAILDSNVSYDKVGKYLNTLQTYNINKLKPIQYDRHLAVAIFKFTFVYENWWISIYISLK